MAIEEKVILEVDIEGLQSLNDYKKALTELRKEKNGLATDSERFNELANQEAQILAKQNKALAVTKEQVIAAEGSFDALNQQLRGLKAQWKATGDEVERAQLGEQINAVKSKMNEMNESIGNFQHNVGNYEGAIKNDLGSNIPLLGSFQTLTQGATTAGGALKNAIGSVKAFGKALLGLLANPVFAVIAGLAAIIMGIVKAIQSSEEQTNRLNVALAPLRRGMDAVLNLLQKMAGGILSVFEGAGRAIDWVMEKLGKYIPSIAAINEESRKAINLEKEKNNIVEDTRTIEAENAKAELEVAKLRTQAKDKEKFTAQERLEFVKRANEIERQMAQRNLDIEVRKLKALEEEASRAENNAETNDKLAEQQAATYRAQMGYFNKTRELLEQENALRAEIAANAKKVTDTINKGIAEIEKADQRRIEEGRKNNEEWMKSQQETAMKAIEAWTDEAETELKVEGKKQEALKKMRDQELKDEEARKKKSIALAQTGVQAVGNVLGSLADIYESNGEQDVKAQAKAKNLRIAGATMDMLSGIVSAISQAMTLGPIAGPIMGAINAGVVSTAGTMNIQKLRNTDTSGNSVPSTTPDIGAMVSAPAIIQQIPITRTLTGASEEERLNQIATNTSKDQRVILVYSDVEAAARRVEVQQDESSF